MVIINDMGDYIKKLEYMKNEDITVELTYRLNFNNEKACGGVKVYNGKIDENQENYEIYMELYECGLNENEVAERYNKLINEIKEGKIDVSFK